LAGYKKPRPRQRSRIITPPEFQSLLRGSGTPFRRLLLALRWTGARPGELRRLRWRHVFLDEGVLVLPEHKTVSRQQQPRPRFIVLPPPVLKLIQWLARPPHSEHDHVFRNTNGKPWTRTALHSQMRRLRDRVGLGPKAGENIVLYSHRHSFGTEAV